MATRKTSNFDPLDVRWPSKVDQIFNDAGIITCDGPPVSHFHIGDPLEPLEIRYHALGFVGKPEEASRAMTDVLQLIAAEIQDQVRGTASTLPVLFWRYRMDFDTGAEGLEKGEISLYCRLATSVPILKEFWSRIEKLEGMPFRRASEL